MQAPTGTLDDALANTTVTTTIFDESKLIIANWSTITASPDAVAATFNSLPPVNQMLWPLMVYNPDDDTLGLPGIFYDGTHAYFYMEVDGAATTQVRVVEEVKYPDANGNIASQFPVNATFQPGVAGVARSCCPTDQFSVSGGRDGRLPKRNGRRPGTAAEHRQPGARPRQPVADERSHRSVRHPHRLGSLGEEAKSVRPYRRTLVGQAVYRREVFQ